MQRVEYSLAQLGRLNENHLNCFVVCAVGKKVGIG